MSKKASNTYHIFINSRELLTNDLNTVLPKLRGRRRNRHETAPLSGLDVSALLATSRPTPKISSENPIPEFRQMLDTTEDPNGIQDAASQLAAVIEKHIKDSFGESEYGRVLAEMGVLRSEMIEMEEPGIWNSWLKELKSKLMSGELGNGRNELWWRIRKEGLGLVTKGESTVSVVADEEAKLVSGSCFAIRFRRYKSDQTTVSTIQNERRARLA